MADATPAAQETPKAEETPKAAEAAPAADAPKEQTLIDTAKAEQQADPKEGEQPQENKDAVTYELKVPEGFTLEDAQVETIKSFAKEHGLSNAQAQAVLEREAQATKSVAEAKETVLTEQKAMLDERHGVWAKELQADKEFGGDQLAESGQLAYRAAEAWFGPELPKLLQEARLNHHPVFFKGLARIGKAMSAQSLVLPNAQSGAKRSTEDIFYNNTTKQD